MLTNMPVHPTLPVVDIRKARRFYEEKPGLKVIFEDSSPGILLQAGEGTTLYIYQREKTKAGHTVSEFEVDNIEAEVRELKGKGVKFEEYNMPSMGIKTVNGIATMDMPAGEVKAAWFKDTEGNILSITQMPK